MKGRRLRPEVAIYGLILLLIVLLAIATVQITKAEDIRHDNTIRYADEFIQAYGGGR